MAAKLVTAAGRVRAAGRLALRLALTALAMFGLSGPWAAAETMLVDGQVQVSPSALAMPTRGLTMQSVEAKFGAPQTRHAAVGQPPITRWDYVGFSVYFERERVIDAVAFGP